MYVRVKVGKTKVENTKTNRRSVQERRKHTLYRNVRKIKGPLYPGCIVIILTDPSYDENYSMTIIVTVHSHDKIYSILIILTAPSHNKIILSFRV